ncbi:ferrous iron transport protein B, partial [Candidatus Bathyarchaeota archaeon]
LIFGILRKELTLIMLATILGTTNFRIALSPLQMFVFSLVTMLYIPCIATIAACIKELGWKKAIFITVFEVLFALLVGGVAYRIFGFFGLQ